VLAEAAGRVARSVAAHLGLAAPLLLRVGTSAVFRCGDTAVRIGAKGAEPEPTIRLVRFLAGAGIPVPVPLAGPFDVDGHPVAIWRWVAATGQPVDGEALGRVVARVHAIVLSDLPGVVNIPSWSERAVADAGPALIEIRSRSLLPRVQLERLEAVYRHHLGWETRTQTPTVVCHGDLHLNNVLVTDDGLCLIDWDTVCLAPACWDHAMFTTLDLWGGPRGFYGAFSRGYGHDYSTDPGCRDLAVPRLLAASANLVLNAQWDNRAAAQVAVRMGYWMGDSSARSWEAV